MKPSDLHSEFPQKGVGQFATTHWSLVLAAGERGNAESTRALEKLCGAYWPPLYAYVRRRVSDIHEAQDLTQAFFERLLEKNFLAEADPDRGRFRAFLIIAFKHFLSKEWDKAKAQKRGGGQSQIALDFTSGDSFVSIEPADTLTAEQVYERQWAITLLDRVMQRLRRETERNGIVAEFHALKDFIVSRSVKSYAGVAAEIGLTESAARMAASRIRRRYRELLREEIAHTISSPEQIDDGVRQLFTTFAN